jgi:hypothetical protein
MCLIESRKIGILASESTARNDKRDEYEREKFFHIFLKKMSHIKPDPV